VTGGDDVSAEQVRLTARISGRVQGVGFRWWTRAQAEQLELVGTATNLPDGEVEVVAEGPRASCERLVELLQSSETPGWVAHVTTRYSRAEGGFADFRER
jgi:acylphosphatase